MEGGSDLPDVFAIGDLHLSFSSAKPMDVFGKNWEHHAEKLEHAWLSLVRPEDLVLIPGDISWAMHFEDALPDLAFLEHLPGKKLLLRGNHDYWWGSLSRLRASLGPASFVLQNDVFRFGNLSICGTRGWICPGSPSFTDQDQKIYLREVQRLSLSLDCADPGTEILVMLHFPPWNEKHQDSLFTELLESRGVRTVLYAHLHGGSLRNAFEGERNGILYRCVSSDFLDFRPSLILPSLSNPDPEQQEVTI